MNKELSPKIYKMIIVAFNILLLISTIYFVTVIITSSSSFYSYEFVKNNTEEVTSYSLSELQEIMKQVVAYLLNHKESMQIKINGANVFSNQALMHMADVKSLYQGGKIITYIGLGLGLILASFMIWHYKYLNKYLLKTSLLTFAVILGLIVIIVSLSALNFDKAFDIFHKIIFPDPIKYRNAFFSSTSYYVEEEGIVNTMLVLILSDTLFIDAGIIIATVTIMALIIWIIIILVLRTFDYNRKRRKIYAQDN